MHNCCGNNYGRKFCPCCGRQLATVCPCCGGSYWGWHNCNPWNQIVTTWNPPIHQPVQIICNVVPAPGSAAFAQQRLAGAA